MDLLKKQFLLWQSQIEKKIPCHFCGAKLSEKIFSCEFGHDCCLSCKTQSCMACPNSNPFLRNRLSEFLISQFNNLKSCAEQLDISAINQKNDTKNSPKVNKATETKIDRHNKMSMVTEEDINIFSGNKATVKSPANGSIEVSDGKLIIQANSDSSSCENLYSCWIGTCNYRGIYENILKHMKASHSSVFTSHELKGWPHVMNWNLNYTGPDSRQDYAFELQGIGLFVLHIFVSSKENLKAHVLMFDSSKIASQYGYDVEIKCDDQKKSFSAVVDSSRMPRRTLQDATKGLFINENSLLLNTIKLRMNFKCLLEINTFNKSIFNGILDSSLKNSENLQKKPSNGQKPRFLNKPNFKPRKNFNHAKNKSNVPALLDLKFPDPPVTQSQVQSAPQPAADCQKLMSLIEQMMANFTQKMTQDKIQVPQAQQSSGINSSSILQPTTEQTQKKIPQNIVEVQASAVKSQVNSTVPTQSASQLQDLLIFDESNKSEEPSLNKVQNPTPETVDETQKTEQEESDSKPNNDCKIN